MATIEELKNSKYWIKPWHQLTSEEKSFIVYRAYQRRVLTTEDIKDFSRLGTWKQRVNFLFPIIVGLPLYKFSPRIFNSFRLKPNELALRIVGTTGLLWLGFQYFNPLQIQYTKEKEELLWTIFERVGHHIIRLNEVLPRFKTENEINRLIVKQQNEYNSYLVDYLYPAQERALPLVDTQNWPKQFKFNKIAH